MAESTTETTTQTVVTNPDGSQTITTITPKEKNPDAPKTGEDYGFSAQFLAGHPEIDEIVKLAIKEEWPQSKFNRVIETETAWGKRLTASQEYFDLNINGGPAEADLRQQIEDQRTRLATEASSLGVKLSDAQINNFAERIVRNKLGNIQVRLFIGKQFNMPETKSVTGDASILANSLKDIAGDYGIMITDTDLEKKVRAGLSSGDDPRTWAEQQRTYYRDQAKNLFPTVAQQLDTYTVREILDPYLSAASSLLGINVQNMNLDDERWTRPLAKADNRDAPMTADEWRTTLRTDEKYGYNKTSQALNEAVDIGNQIISIMGSV
jgi:hypothetical protein